MKKLLTAFLAVFTLLAAASSTASEAATPDTLIKEHLLRYGPQEMFSAIQVSIKAKDTIHTYTVGNRSLGPDSKPISAEDPFDIGSISKSYTGALAVMAESEHKLKLQDRLDNYLPAYSHWGQLTLTSLLHMSSGIPNYIVQIYDSKIGHYWRSEEQTLGYRALYI